MVIIINLLGVWNWNILSLFVPQDKALQERTTKLHGSPVLQTLSNHELPQIKPLQLTTVWSNLHCIMPLGKHLQWSSPKSFNPMDAAGCYFPNAHDKRDKKSHEVNRWPTNLLYGGLPGCLPPQRSNLITDRLEHEGGQALSPGWLQRFPQGSRTQK